MFSAADLIEAVQRRLRLVHRRSHPPGEFPPGWAEWFDAMRDSRGLVDGAPAEAMVAVLLARAPAAAPAGPFRDLSRWQAFSSVVRQDWSTGPSEDRGLAIASGLVSLLANLFFAVMFLWLLFAPSRFEPPAAAGEEVVVQVEYIGEGTPDTPGGGPDAPAEPVAEPVPEPPRPVAATPVPTDDAVPEPGPQAPEPASLPPVPEVPVASTPPELSVPDSVVAEREVPTPQPPAPAVEQRVMVSEPSPDTTDAVFLPPPTPTLAPPTLAAPDLVSEAPSVRAREVPVPEAAPTPPALAVQARERPVAPQLQGAVEPMQRREIPTPVRRPALSVRPEPQTEAPTLRTSETVAVRERSIPQPAARVAPAPSPPAATPATAGLREPASDPSRTRAPSDPGDAAVSARSDSGPRSTPAPGGWPTPARADDFGASDRNVPGGQRGNDGPGLFDGDGSVRLAEMPGSASPGQPPGAYSEEITDLDRNGTWLKRPPVGYEPTLFDRYWRPNETLLQEWVRRGVKSVSIPIPGTGKKIECAVSLLALGGGCGISDPNLNEQPATARPPPDIPFKPELQDDNGSIRPVD